MATSASLNSDTIDMITKWPNMKPKNDVLAITFQSLHDIILSHVDVGASSVSKESSRSSSSEGISLVFPEAFSFFYAIFEQRPYGERK